MEPAHEFTGGEVIALLEILNLVGLVREPNVTNRQIPGERIGRGSYSLYTSLRMFPSKAAYNGHSGRQRQLPDPQSNEAVADIRREFASAAARLRRWADRCR